MSRKQKNKEPQTLVDVMIPVYGRFDILKKCLDAIPDAMGDVPYKIYIFDNASPEEEAKLFYPLDKSIRVIKSKENVGFPRSCNRMVATGKSPLIFLLNSDVILGAGSADLLVREMDNPQIGVAGMKLVFPVDHDGLNEQIRPAGKLQHIGLTTTINSQVIHAFMAWNPDHPRVMAQREVFAVTGAAFMTRRDLWRKVGGFDEMYGKGTFEDVDYCMMMRQMGYNVIVNPVATGIHYTGATVEKYNLGYNLGQNYNLFMQKWQGKLQWWHYKQA